MLLAQLLHPILLLLCHISQDFNLLNCCRTLRSYEWRPWFVIFLQVIKLWTVKEKHDVDNFGEILFSCARIAIHMEMVAFLSCQVAVTQLACVPNITRKGTREISSANRRGDGAVLKVAAIEGWERKNARRQGGRSTADIFLLLSNDGRRKLLIDFLILIGG